MGIVGVVLCLLAIGYPLVTYYLFSPHYFVLPLDLLIGGCGLVVGLLGAYYNSLMFKELNKKEDQEESP